MPRKQKAESPRYIAEGFKDDCMTLLSKFQATNSACFADFLKVWQEMKFSWIFCGLNSFAEVLEFTEEALGISKNFFLPPHSDIARIGALYLMYGVYTQQPTRGLVKIRMTPEDWAHSMEFIENVRRYGYADANFIFHTLCYDAAFFFTASDREYGLERALRKLQMVSRHLREMEKCQHITSTQLLKPVFQDVDVRDLEKLRKQYEVSKSLIPDGGPGMEFTPMVPSESIISSLKEAVEKCINADPNATTSTSKKSRNIREFFDESSSSDDEHSESDIGQGRRNLKTKAFSKKNRGQKHLKSCQSSTSTETSATNEESKTDKIPEGPAERGTPNLTSEDAESAAVHGLFEWRSKHPLFFSRRTRKKGTSSCDNETAANRMEEGDDDPDEIEPPDQKDTSLTLPNLDQTLETD